MYATLNPDLLTANDSEREAIRADPTVSLDQQLFLQNPLPMLELQREFILGTREQRWKATLAHRFVELLHCKTGKLKRLYTQNIDGTNKLNFTWQTGHYFGRLTLFVRSTLRRTRGSVH